eukprot:764477-Hanusia_phi.AAC.8
MRDIVALSAPITARACPNAFSYLMDLESLHLAVAEINIETEQRRIHKGFAYQRLFERLQTLEFETVLQPPHRAESAKFKLSFFPCLSILAFLLVGGAVEPEADERSDSAEVLLSQSFFDASGIGTRLAVVRLCGINHRPECASTCQDGKNHQNEHQCSISFSSCFCRAANIFSNFFRDS